jgi:hypothetical protein
MDNKLYYRIRTRNSNVLNNQPVYLFIDNWPDNDPNQEVRTNAAKALWRILSNTNPNSSSDTRVVVTDDTGQAFEKRFLFEIISDPIPTSNVGYRIRNLQTGKSIYIAPDGSWIHAWTDYSTDPNMYYEFVRSI